MNAPTERDHGELNDVGLVAIGRNEGARLVRCLESIPSGVRRSVYVDSGSTDDSVAEAKRRGVEIVALDTSIPFSAARARNAGFERLMQLHPDLAMVHFVDGDCEIMSGWMQAAADEMRSAVDIVAVCGYRRERFPEQSPYNTICDVEWRIGSPGETRSFGGDVLIRAAALQGVGGYDEKVIAAEDDELGVRLRNAGGRMVRLDRVSTLHEADILHFSQWWQRAKRCGYAYAHVSDLHGAPPERYFVDELRRTLKWGLALPALAVGLSLPSFGLSLSLLGAYPVQAYRTFRRTQERGFSLRESVLWGVSCTVAKVPEVSGILKYRLDRRKHRRPTIIEYKGR